MTPDQLTASLPHRKVLCSTNVTAMNKTASVRFLDMKMTRKGYTRRVVETQKTILEMSWPTQINRTSAVGGSRALFLEAQTNRGLQNGRVAKRTFDVPYATILEKARALAKCCEKELPYLRMYITQLVAGQGLSQHRDYRNNESYLNYTINFGKYEGGHLEMLRGRERQSRAVPLVWTESTADIIEHRLQEATLWYCAQQHRCWRESVDVLIQERGLEQTLEVQLF